MISCATLPAHRHPAQREPRTRVFPESSGPSCCLCSCACIYHKTQDLEEDQSFFSTSGKSLVLLWAYSVCPFPKNATFLFWDLCGCTVPCRADLFPYLVGWSCAGSRAGLAPSLTPPACISVQCLGLHGFITMQALINSPSRLCATVAKPSCLPWTESLALLSV